MNMTSKSTIGVAKMPIAIIICAGCAFTASADQIVTRTADVFECTVSSVNETNVKYRKPGETFDREILISDIFKIKYTNGEEDNFANIKHQASRQHEGLSESGQYINTETEPDWSLLPPAQHTYQTGDWYSENGVEGIVIWTTPDGLHGRIIHKDKWNAAKFKKPVAFFTGPTDICLGMKDITNGYANMLSLKEFMHSNPKYPIEMFPIQKIASDIGEGWYLPSIKELEYLSILRETSVTYSGSNPEFRGKTMAWRKIINSVSKRHGGVNHDDYYKLSSTETYSQGEAAATFEVLYGDPSSPQFALFKLENGAEIRQVIRDEGRCPFYLFHLF